jgi:multiple sugar transport system permease protein
MTTSSASGRGTGKQVILYAILFLVLLWTLVPILWMVLASFKPGIAQLSSTPVFVFKPTLQHYVALFTGGDLGSYFLNSVLAAGISTVIAVSLGCLAGYGLARSHFRGKQHVAFWIISTRMAPIAAIVLPLFILFRYVNLLDSIPGLIVAYLTFNLPFAIWIMNAFFTDLPPALEEAAMVDGASRFQAFYRVALPLVTPGIVTTAILCLVFSWNDYAFAATFSGPNSQTLPIAAAQLNTQTGLNWGQLSAIGTIVVLPMMVVGLAVRRYLVKGLTLGAVTGE